MAVSPSTSEAVITPRVRSDARHLELAADLVDVGARRGELLALEWSDIDWLTSTLSISKSLEQTSAGVRVKRPKSERARKFRLGKTAMASLRFLHEQQQEHRRLYGGDYDGNLVFCEPDGRHLWPHLVSKAIVRKMTKVAIKDASLHTLRHTLASHLLSAGVPLTVVSKMLGHADSVITLRIYSHMLPADDTRAADTWENIVTAPRTNRQIEPAREKVQ